MTRYRNDPYWTKAHHSAYTCPKCKKLCTGRVYYFPLSKACYCEECGKDQEATFRAAVFDEEFGCR